MIPISFLSKISQYPDIQNVKVKVRVADQAALIDTGVSELKSSVTQKQRHLAALDLKIDRSEAALLIVYVGGQCLIIQLGYLDFFPESPQKFLEDPNVLFVGMGTSNIVSRFDEGFNTQEQYKKRYVKCKSGVELTYLAARVLKNPDLMQEYELEKLVDVAGMKIYQSTVDCPKTPWKARVFSVEQVKLAVLDVHNVYVLASKFLDLV